MEKSIIYILLVCCFSISTVSSGQEYHPSDALEALNDIRAVLLEKVGTMETGWNTGPGIDELFEVSEFDPGVAYCSITIMWGFEQIGVEYNGTPWSPSWFVEATTIYKKGKFTFYTPRFGDVFGIYFRSKGRVAHVGFIMAWLPEQGLVMTLEGNAKDSRGREGIVIKFRKIDEIYMVARYIW